MPFIINDELPVTLKISNVELGGTLEYAINSDTGRVLRAQLYFNDSIEFSQFYPLGNPKLKRFIEDAIEQHSADKSAEMQEVEENGI